MQIITYYYLYSFILIILYFCSAFKYWPKKPLERFYGFQSPIQIHKASVPTLDLPKLQFFGHWTCQGLALIENIGTTGNQCLIGPVSASGKKLLIRHFVS